MTAGLWVRIFGLFSFKNYVSLTAEIHHHCFCFSGLLPPLAALKFFFLMFLNSRFLSFLSQIISPISPPVSPTHMHSFFSQISPSLYSPIPTFIRSFLRSATQFPPLLHLLSLLHNLWRLLWPVTAYAQGTVPPCFSVCMAVHFPHRKILYR